jgi:hypothetical protein
MNAMFGGKAELGIPVLRDTCLSFCHSAFLWCTSGVSLRATSCLRRALAFRNDNARLPSSDSQHMTVLADVRTRHSYRKIAFLPGTDGLPCWYFNTCSVKVDDSLSYF